MIIETGKTYLVMGLLDPDSLAYAIGRTIQSMGGNVVYTVQKAALEALVRALARRHGRDHIRVNTVSAGPLWTKAASKIPGFGCMTRMWNKASPLPWDTRKDKQAVANAVVFLLGPYSAKITGQTLTVDGGASIVAGQLHEFEGGTESLDPKILP
jgi:enoyl-[acyl-carrier-protein] reductase (NADH)